MDKYIFQFLHVWVATKQWIKVQYYDDAQNSSVEQMKWSKNAPVWIHSYPEELQKVIATGSGLNRLNFWKKMKQVRFKMDEFVFNFSFIVLSIQGSNLSSGFFYLQRKIGWKASSSF